LSEFYNLKQKKAACW